MSEAGKLVHHLLDDACNTWPDQTFVRTKDQSVTLSGLRDRAFFYARILKDVGVLPGDRIVIEAANSIDSVAVIFATLAIGAAFCPIHTSAPDMQRRYVTENSAAALSVCFSDNRVFIKKAAANHTVPVFNAREANGGPLGSLNPGIISEDIACLIYTSGSTGQPKGVTCLHRQVIFAAFAIADALEYKPADTVFVAQPLSFDYGLYQIFLCLIGGATLYLADPGAAGLTLFKALASSKATILPAVPPMLDNLAVMAKRKPGALHRLRLITNTGAAAQETSVQSLRQCLPDLKFQLMYGLTECKRAAINPPDADILRPSSCGLPLKDTEIKIIDENGHRAGPGVVGEIVIRGPHVMAGYWNDEELSKQRYFIHNATMKELRTGDFGWLDEDGYLYCQGRRDDIFKQRGYRVSCSEIEAAASAIEGVKSAVLIPPDGKRPSVLFVSFDDGEFDIIKDLGTRLEEFKLPGRCVSMSSIPTNSNGKFDRKQLEKSIRN